MATQVRDVLEEHRSVLDASTTPMLLVDVVGTLVYANAAAHRLFRYPPGALCGLGVEDLVDEALRARHGELRRGFSEARSRAMAFGRRVRGRCADGSPIDVDVALEPVQLGGAKGVVATVHDLSVDRVRLRDEEGLARFEELAESLPDPVWVGAVGGRAKYVNGRWSDYTGLPRHALLGWGWLDIVHPEERGLVEECAARALASGDPWSVLCRLLGADGAFRSFKLQARPVHDARGNVLRWYGSATDVEELRLTNAGLAELNSELEARVSARTRDLARVTHRVLEITAQLAAAQDLSAMGSWSMRIEPDARIDASTAMMRMFGVDALEQGLDGLSGAFDEPHWATLRDAFDRLIEEQLPYRLELPYRRPDGSSGWLIARGSVMDASAPLYVVGAFQDVSRMVEAHQQLERRSLELERSNEDLAQFAYAASHDLQEPLRAVSGCAQILRSRYGERLDPQGENLIEHIVDGADRMRNLVQDLLTYSRVGTVQRAHVPVALDEVILLAWEDLRARVAETGAALDAAPLPVVVGDLSQLRQLFANLFSNALKYRSERPPRVGVRVGIRGSEVDVDVSDNGIGIAPTYHERVFVLFERLHTRVEYPGTGIGLALCRRIAEKHGGTIRIVPRDGVGTTVRVTLPLETS